MRYNIVSFDFALQEVIWHNKYAKKRGLKCVRKSFSRFIHTNEDWYGNWGDDEDFVLVMLEYNKTVLDDTGVAIITLTASGNDDHYLVRHVKCNAYDIEYWKEWINRLPVIADHQFFFDWGFKEG